MDSAGLILALLGGAGGGGGGSSLTPEALATILRGIDGVSVDLTGDKVVVSIDSGDSAENMVLASNGDGTASWKDLGSMIQITGVTQDGENIILTIEDK